MAVNGIGRLFLSGENQETSWDEGIGFETIVSDGG